MSRKPIDPKETYVVREVFCCGEGHCPGIRFTHWESGEACVYEHEKGSSNEDCHFYWRLALTPMYKGNPDPTKDQYAEENGNWWEFANQDDNVNKWCHLTIAPRGLVAGTVIKPGEQAVT
jgi:hypothetical protein